MSTKNHPALLTLALCALLIPAVVGAQNEGARRAGAFPSFIAFDLSQMELPAGVAVDKVGNVYVSIGATPAGPMSFRSDQIWKFSPSGEKSLFADFGPPGGAAASLAVDAVGNVYMTRTLTAMPYNGVYRVDRDGNIALVPGTNQIGFPNALAFDQQGTLYVTETASVEPSGGFGPGGIWRVPKDGTAELWLRHELLNGTGSILFPYPAGANGIAFYLGSLYVINTDKNLVVRIAVLPDGSPGQPEQWTEVQDVFESPSYFPLQIVGLALDVLGNVYVTMPSRGAVVRINAQDRSQETFAMYPSVPLDCPMKLAFGTANGECESLLVANGGGTGLFDPGSWPGPSVVKIEVGIPGVPLP